MEGIQSQKADDNKAFSKQKKNDEKYHARKLLLTNRKEDVSRNIRDLGVLPEEAFAKYIDENLDRVRMRVCSECAVITDEITQ